MLLMHQLISWISHYVQGFIHVWWCRISSINSIMYVIPLVCRVFPERGWKIGRCFWPARSQNHIRKSCRIFPMETCESLWSEGVGILHKSYGPILHILCKWPLLVTFWVPGDSGKGPCASCTTARTPQEVFEDVYHWHPLICQKRMDFECVPPRKCIFHSPRLESVLSRTSGSRSSYSCQRCCTTSTATRKTGGSNLDDYRVMIFSRFHSGQGGQEKCLRSKPNSGWSMTIDMEEFTNNLRSFMMNYGDFMWATIWGS